MLTVGDIFPDDFELKAVRSGSPSEAFSDFTSETDKGSWKVFFFYPKDFTFICPTEIAGFNDLNDDFEKLDAKLYGVSTDSDFVHLAWQNSDPLLQNLKFPLISDIKKDLSYELGILDESEAVCLRATYIVDPKGVIRHASVNDLSVGRNPQEILRTLEALQTNELTPCAWKRGEDVIKVA